MYIKKKKVIEMEIFKTYIEMLNKLIWPEISSLKHVIDTNCPKSIHNRSYWVEKLLQAKSNK